MDDNARKQKVMSDLWEKHKHKAITGDDGTYIDLDNFNIGDHGLSMEDMRTPGNQSLSSTKNRDSGYFMRSTGGRFQLFKG